MCECCESEVGVCEVGESADGVLWKTRTQPGERLGKTHKQYVPATKNDTPKGKKKAEVKPEALKVKADNPDIIPPHKMFY